MPPSPPGVPHTTDHILLTTGEASPTLTLTLSLTLALTLTLTRWQTSERCSSYASKMSAAHICAPVSAKADTIVNLILADFRRPRCP